MTDGPFQPVTIGPIEWSKAPHKVQALACCATTAVTVELAVVKFQGEDGLTLVLHGLHCRSCGVAWAFEDAPVVAIPGTDGQVRAVGVHRLSTMASDARPS